MGGWQALGPNSAILQRSVSAITVERAPRLQAKERCARAETVGLSVEEKSKPLNKSLGDERSNVIPLALANPELNSAR